MTATAGQVRWVPVEEIIDEEQPLEGGNVITLQQRADGKYTLLSGRQRLEEKKREGALCVDAVLSPTILLEERLTRLLDALVRGKLHYLDEAQAYSDLIGSGAITLSQLAARMGRTPATLRRKLRLMDLSPEAARSLRHNGLCERYAQELLRLPGQQGRMRVLKHVTDGGLSIRETEKLIDDVLSRMPVPMTGGRRLKPLMRDYRLYLNAMRGIVEQMTDAGLDAGMQVSIGKTVAEVRITVPLFARGGK